MKQTLLNEGLVYKDLKGMVKPTIHVDEFSSKMGDDDDVAVLSFFLRDKLAAKDLINWFEKGYDFILDADSSPGEIKPNRYLVYVEISRRSRLGNQVFQLLDDLSTLTEFSPEEWNVHHDNKTFPFSVEEFNSHVPLSPKDYRQKKEQSLNTVREAAGLPVKAVYAQEKDQIIKNLQNIAGI